MIEFFYLDREGRELGSIFAHSFRDAHAWLGHMGFAYHEITRFRPRSKSRKRVRGQRVSAQLELGYV